MQRKFSDDLLKEITSKTFKGSILNLSEKDITNEQTHALVDALNTNPDITQLFLAGCLLTDDQAKTLSNLTHITDLDVSDNALSNQGAAALTKLPLKKLNLSSNLIKGKNIAKAITQSKILTNVDLSENDISNSAAKFFLNNPQLIHCNLDGNPGIKEKIFKKLHKKFKSTQTPNNFFKPIRIDPDLLEAAAEVKKETATPKTP